MQRHGSILVGAWNRNLMERPEAEMRSMNKVSFCTEKDDLIGDTHHPAWKATLNG